MDLKIFSYKHTILEQKKGKRQSQEKYFKILCTSKENMIKRKLKVFKISLNKRSGTTIELLWKVTKLLMAIIILVFVIIPIIISIIDMFKPDKEATSTLHLIAYEVKQLKEYVNRNNLDSYSSFAPFYVRSKYMISVENDNICLKDKNNKKTYECKKLALKCDNAFLHIDDNKPRSLIIKVYRTKGNGQEQELRCNLELAGE